MPLSANYHINLQTYTNRDDWIRTSGPFVPNEVRYQAAPHPAIKMAILSNDTTISKK
jgi:hypothetical protein